MSCQNEIKMKSNKSQKNITIITDRKSQYDLFANEYHSSLNKGSKTCTNQIHKSPCNKMMPMSTKNIVENIQSNFGKDDEASSKKSKRQRSTSSKNKFQNVQNQQNRKKQLDFLCFQRIVNQFKKYFLQRQQNWDFNCLCYGQLIKLLWICRFVPHPHEEQYIECNEQAQLKKIYLLWLSISIKKILNLRDFLIFIQIIENIYVDQQKIQSVIYNLEAQIKPFCMKSYDNFQQDPNYTFFIKKIQIPRKNNCLVFSQPLREKISAQFRSFKLNKLKDTGIYQCVKVEQQQQILVSKKSSQLADQKRRKIQKKIRQKKPHVQNIDLLDLLSYRQRDHIQNIKKPSPVITKKPNVNPPFKKGQIKRQLQLLSKPKVHFEERKEDQINFEKQEDEFTFHPKINPYRSSSRQKILQIKNADKVLVRMKQARKIKQQKQNIMQKGWNNHQKNDSMKLSKSKNFLNQTPIFQNIETKQSSNLEQKFQFNDHNKQNENILIKQKQQLQKPKSSKLTKYEVSKDYLRIPILYIDVNIQQGKKERIIIYDNDKAQVLAKQFGQKHKLSEETISRLEVLLQQQMDTVLARIDEQTDDQCSIVY